MKKINYYVYLFVVFFFLSSCESGGEDILENSKIKTKPEKSVKLKKYKLANQTLIIKELNNEFYLADDIILSEEQINKLKNASNKGAAITSLASRWDNCTIPYVISSDLRNPSRVLSAMDEWVGETDVQFVRRTYQSDYVEFVSSSDICQSYFGKIGGRQEIRLANGCTTGSVIHEIGHALGLFHEQSRTDRNNFININFNNIIPGKESNFQTYEEIGYDGFQLNSFDFNSIMLYSSFSFSRNGEPTITRIDGSTFTANRSSLSQQDIAIINSMYNCPLIGGINGPTRANNTGTYTWTANAHNGDEPYTYYWRYNTDRSNNYPHFFGQGKTIVASMPLDKDLKLQVTITDANGETIKASRITLNTDSNNGSGGGGSGPPVHP